VTVDTRGVPLPPVVVTPVTTPTVTLPPPMPPPVQPRDFLEVKFNDGRRIRLLNGQPADVAPPVPVTTGAARLVAEYTRGRAKWYVMHTVPEQRLNALRQRAMANLRRPVPDLSLWFVAEMPPGLDPLPLLARLAALPEMEYAAVMPPAALPAVPDLTQPNNGTGVLQGYLHPSNTRNGIDALYAWRAHRGDGVKLCDVEFNFDPDHPDLPPVDVVGDGPSGDFADQPGNVAHGTSVLGEIASLDDDIGTTGIAPEVELHFAAVIAGLNPFSNIAGAISRCAEHFDAGDVILIEQQVFGPTSPDECLDGSCQDGMVAAEWDRAVFDAIVTAVGNDMVVVEAAGNGSQDLDNEVFLRSPHPFVEHHLPFVRDSGAIMVGAGRSADSTDDDGDLIGQARQPLGFTNFGSRVDVQGWGNRVLTTVSGELPDDVICDDADDDGTANEQPCYDRSFGGTSSASPIVAGAVVLLQGIHKDRHGEPMTPADVRRLLVQTGVRQPSMDADRHIGPLPNLRAAVDVLRQAIPMPLVDVSGNATFDEPGGVRLAYPPGLNFQNALLYFTLNGEDPDIDRGAPHTWEYVPDSNPHHYIPVVRNVTLKAVSYLRGVTDPATGGPALSAILERHYYVADESVGPVQFSLPAGTYAAPQEVRVSHADPSATIWYTLAETGQPDEVPAPQPLVPDGTMLAWDGTIDLRTSLAPVVTIKARAFLAGPDGELLSGPVTTVTYQLTATP
jgi:hypothetical protein